MYIECTIMAFAYVMAVLRYNFINWNLVALMSEWHQRLLSGSTNKKIQRMRAKRLPTQDIPNYKESFAVYHKIAALFCDAGWMSAEQHSSYFYRGWWGTHCSRTGGESAKMTGRLRGGEKVKWGESKEGTAGEGLPQHGYTAGPLSPLLVDGFPGCYQAVQEIELSSCYTDSW